MKWSIVLWLPLFSLVKVKAECPPDLFECTVPFIGGNKCISKHWHCDGERDCNGGADEADCLYPVPCNEGQFTCTGEHQCIPGGWVCDKEQDCSDGSDESESICRQKRQATQFGDEFSQQTCQPNQFLCDSGDTCIPISYLCDGQADCPSGMDEGPQCQRHCSCGRVDISCKPLSIGGELCDCGALAFYNETSGSCQDLNECDYDGYCEQLCVNMDPLYNCSCTEGYHLKYSTCQADGDPYRILYTGGNANSANASSDQKLILAATNASVKLVDFNFRNSSYCYIFSQVLRCALFDEPLATWDVQITTDFTDIADMAFDWLALNWYFTQGNKERIFMCSNDGVWCQTLVSADLKKTPVAIAVDPTKGFVFFSVLGETAKIERMGMEGSGRSLLVSQTSIVRPACITLDYANQHLYWVDVYANRLERINYDGTRRTLISLSKRVTMGVHGLSMFENSLYLASARNMSLLKYSRNPLSDSQPEYLAIGLVNPSAIKVVQQMRQPAIGYQTLPCEEKACSQLCVTRVDTSPPTAQCVCTSGYKLDPSNDTLCISALNDKFLFYGNAKLGEIRGMSLDPAFTADTMIPITGLQKPMAVDFDQNYIYYSDAVQMKIGRQALNGSSAMPNLLTGVGNCEGLAVDYMANNIYWSDDTKKTISVASIGNTKIRKVLVHRDTLSHPRAIVVCPAKGIMFWSDWVTGSSEERAKIERSYLDGSGRQVWISDLTQWPNGLSIDALANKLYWCDAFFDRIESVDLDDNTNRRLLVHAKAGNIHHPFGLTHNHEGDNIFLYWTEFRDGHIKRAGPFKSNDTSQVSTVIVRSDSVPLFEISLYESRTGKNLCSYNYGGCGVQTLCLMQGEMKRVCVCPDGTTKMDNNTCQPANGTDEELCGANNFRCTDGSCIHEAWQCDGENDCPDALDESDCENVCSGEDMIRCDDNRCITRHSLCHVQCGGAEEERAHQCPDTPCNVDQRRCRNNLCIPSNWFCDTDNDCGDWSDEENCTENAGCDTNYYRCANGRCISFLQICDGIDDCGDRTDENHCPPVRCTGAEFECLSDHTCISNDLVCDGTPNCPDQSDESDAFCPDTDCSDTEFVCDNGLCINSILRCDGDDDCGDSSDEVNCTTIHCPEGFLRCQDESKCVPPSWLCDGENDCASGSDEVNCTATPEPCAYPDWPCDDAGHQCNQWGVCSQRCRMIMGHTSCYCDPGYHLNLTDDFTCIPEDLAHTYLIYSNRHEIQRLDIGDQTHMSLVSGLTNTIALDFYYNQTPQQGVKPGDDSLVFWTDVVEDKIYKGTHKGNSITDVTTLVSIGLATTEGLAVDWVTKHIYWVESNLDQIEVADFNGRDRLSLVAGDIDSPRAIVLDPGTGWLFWTDWQSRKSRIERCTLSGENRSVIFDVSSISGAGWPNGLTVDYETRRLFWIDAKSDSIHSIDYNGRDPRLIRRGHDFLSHPFSIAVFGNFVYWTDWRTNSIVKANKWNGTELGMVKRTLTQPFDLFIFHPKRQPIYTNPCQENNGGCGTNAVCLIGLKLQPRCRCPHLYRPVAGDSKNCELEEKIMLYSKKQEIRGVDMASFTYNIMPPLTHVIQPTALDYDGEGEWLYWTDNDAKSGVQGVKRVRFNGTDSQTIIDSYIENAEGFAIDWASGNMYFSSYTSTSASISVARLDGTYRTVLIDRNSFPSLGKPHSLAVHPQRGELYWADQDRAAIFRAFLDGSDAVQLYPTDRQTTPASKPSNLMIDNPNAILWWINVATSPGTASHIAKCNMGDCQATILPSQHLPEKPQAIAINNNTLYIATANNLICTVRLDAADGDVNATTCITDISDVTTLNVFQRHRDEYGIISCGDSTRGGCSQLCLPHSKNHTCRCVAGYTLDSDDRKTCRGISSFLLYSSGTDIVGIPLSESDSTSQALASISHISKAMALEVHIALDWIFWVDYGKNTISRVKRDLSQQETLVESGMLGVEGIAVDWIADNLYWTDHGRDVIEVARLDGSHRFVVVHENVDRPGSLAVDPVKGFLYWSDWSGQTPRISRSRLDGSRQEVLFNDTVIDSLYTYSLTLDYEKNILYWCDRKRNLIMAMNLTTRSKSQIRHENVDDCMGLIYYNGRLYWTDVSFLVVNGTKDSTERRGSILSVDIASHNLTYIKQNLGQSIRDVKVFDKQRQSVPVPCLNPCGVNNGGCAELCLYNGTHAVCKCAHGRVDNKTQCKDYESFLAFSTASGIETVHFLESPTPPKPAISDDYRMKNVIGLAFDYQRKRYFFSDINRGAIDSVPFDGTPFTTILDNVGSVEGLAYDPVYHELYWTSYSNASISRISVNPHRSNPQPEQVVLLGDLDRPRAIVLDSCQSRMFWTNWNERRASIMTSHLTGWGVEEIINTNIHTPNGLTIDHADIRLYWSDARLDKIERCDFDGSNRRTIVEGYPQHVFGLVVYGESLYWTDWLLRAVIGVNKYTGTDVSYLKRDIARQPMGIIAVADDAADCTLNPCNHNNGGCQQTCDSNNGTAVCSCEADMTLQANGFTCVRNASNCSGREYNCMDGGCIAIELTCNGVSDCPDNSDENENYCNIRLCPSDYFHCRNRRCISDHLRCDGQNDCGDDSDETNCMCPRTQFMCRRDESCIHLTSRCDGERDCPDYSDEMNCPDFSCHDEEGRELIKCPHTTACIEESWKCDGNNDCWDNWDEVNCTTGEPPACLDGMRKCGSGECIHDTWWCDGDADCEDRSDEGTDCNHSCAPGQMQCDLWRCIPDTMRCDRQNDCWDGTDELHCVERNCDENEFTCNSTGTAKCIPRLWMCDGERDCPNGDDETTAAGCVNPMQCNEDEFQCANFLCIPDMFVCDRDDDCMDKSDEPDWCTYETCEEDEFQCLHISHCIPATSKCDGFIDCADHSDETNSTCTLPPPCGEDGFLCNNGACVNNSRLLCNGIDDCGDFSDELRCNINECEFISKFDCTYCVDKKIGYQCSCDPGFEVGGDNKTCQDVNECDRFLCSQYCENTYGSFHCSCASDYYLHHDKRSCVPVTKVKPIILVSNRYYIRQIHETSSGHGREELLVQDLSNAVALDYDWQEQMVYWSDVTSGGSNISRMMVNGTQRQTLHNTTIRNPDGLAVDWLGRNLYWCDKTTDTIEVSKLSGLYRKVLVDTGLMEPRGLALHPFKGWLFYTDWGEDAHIGRLGMDGSDRSRIINNTHLGWPNALAINYITDHVYWADARLDYIAFTGLDGGKINYVLRENLPHIFAITVFGDYVYWTDWEYKRVERANRFTGQNRTNITQIIHRPMGIQMFHPLRQPQSFRREQLNPCQGGGGCGNGTLCLIRPGGQERACVCPERHYLSRDKKTCIANCTSSEFMCASTFKCIPSWWKCDRQDDCGDGSDEPADCKPRVCRQPGQFQCDTANSPLDCIVPTQICDGTAQCGDGSDEWNCTTHTCMASQFKCRDPPQCIPGILRCNGKTDCKDGADEEGCQHQCAKNQFKCDNNRCIPLVWRCDHDDDCGDHSDEPDNCSNITCPALYHKCTTSGRCIPELWRCDGEPDCGQGDTSDEPESCQEKECEPTYFKCNNSRCIPGRWRCDYDNDCRDNSDEVGCLPRNCSESEFQCANLRCILNDFRCDGVNHCANGSDEEGCDGFQCQTDEIACDNQQYCYKKAWRCDGEADCTDASDEAGCTIADHNCTAREFSCQDRGGCVPMEWLCDGDDDCYDKSDENAMMCMRHRCEFGYFRCDNSHCIPQDFRCDGEDDCGDRSDERQCLKPSKCGSEEFRCSKTLECISTTLVCDGVDDCIDGSDESLHCDMIDNCTSDINCTTPHQKCMDTKYGSKCSCEAGYNYNFGTEECIDVDECRGFGICSQTCSNRKGNYLCGCHSNYMLVPSSKEKTRVRSTCKAKGGHPYLLIATENQLHAMELHTSGSYTRINATEGLPDLRIASVAVIMGQQPKAFLSDVHNGAIYQISVPPSLDSHGSKKVIAGSGRNTRSAASTSSTVEVGNPPAVKPVDMSVDWVAGHLYWLDAGTQSLEMLSINDSKRTTLISSNIEQPLALVVDPISNLLFMSQTGRRAMVSRARLDGSQRQVLVHSKVVWPGGLAMDHEAGRLYWTDMKRRTIETVKLDGSDRKLLWKFTKHDNPPHKIDVFEEFLYITTYTSHNVLRLSKYGDRNLEQTKLVVRPTQIGKIAVVQESMQMNLSADLMRNPCGFTDDCEVTELCVNLDVYGNHTCVPTNGASSTNCIGYCHHQGSCSNTQHGNPKCLCPQQYTGSRCEVDLCFGLCVKGDCVPDELNGGVMCSCDYDYEGSRCDHYKCSDYCQHGLCQVSKGSRQPRCVQCSFGWMGERCHIKKEHPCDGHECKNGGNCTAGSNGRPSCSCPTGYTGDKCELCNYSCAAGSCIFNCTSEPEAEAYCVLGPDDRPSCHCSANYRPSNCSADHTPGCQEHCISSCTDFCQNGGECINVADPVPTCRCPLPYYGPHCRESYCERCDLQNTVNPGCETKTEPDTSVSVRCNCKPGWFGKYCNISQVCLDNRCQNGSQCIPDDTGATKSCICGPGFSGEFCEKDVGCGEAHCQHDSICIKTKGGYACNCSHQYMGMFCEKRMPDRCQLHCGHGMCKQCAIDPSISDYTCSECLCPVNYSGTRCEVPDPGIVPYTSTSSSSASIAAVVVPLLLGIAIIFAIVGFCIYRKRASYQFRHKRMTDGETGNVEINNPMYMKDYEDDDTGDPLTFDPDRKMPHPRLNPSQTEPTNFSNPMYDQMYDTSFNGAGSSEKNKLLSDSSTKKKPKKRSILDDDEEEE